MAKKYLSLEEAAQLLGVRTDEVMRLREKGDLRGFADRGTWKFKADDVEEAKRRRQPDSSPDVSLIDDDDFSGSALHEEPRSSRNASDSDVRLVFDDDLKSRLTGSSGDVPVFPAGDGTDSDVRLVGAPSGIKKRSDSDVKLIKNQPGKKTDSDSDVRLAAPGGRKSPDSDSDVRLAMPPGSDSDVKLVEPRGGGSALDARNPGDSILLDDDDSGIALHGDSGISLSGDSSLRLSGESGIQLRRPQDSGILLEGGKSGFNLADEDDDFSFKLADDSGIKVGDKAPSASGRGSSPAMSLDEDAGQTIPMLFDDEADGDRTDPEVPLLSDDDDDLMPRSFDLGDATQAEASVILFDEDDDLDEAAVTTVRKKSGGLSSKELDAETFELDEAVVDDEEVLDAEDDSFADEDLEEVFASDDDEFSDTYSEEGMSAADFSTARAMSTGPAAAEWSAGTVTLLAFSSLFMVAGAWMAVDLLNVVFAAGSPTYNGMFVEAIGGLFK